MNSLQVRVAGTTIGRHPGRHQLFISVAGKPLANIPFHVLTMAEVLERIQVSPLTVTVITKSNQRISNPQSLVAGETSALGVSCELTVGVLSPGQSTEVNFELHVDDANAAQKSAAVSLAHRRQSFKLRQVSLATLVPHAATGTKRLTVVVSLAGQTRQRLVTTVTCLHRITNFEGQLNIDPARLDVSNEEYEAILRRL